RLSLAHLPSRRGVRTSKPLQLSPLSADGADGWSSGCRSWCATGWHAGRAGSLRVVGGRGVGDLAVGRCGGPAATRTAPALGGRVRPSLVGAVFAVLGTVLRAGWRYRSELAPPAVSSAVWWAGWRLYHSHPAAWPALAVLAPVLAAAVVWAPGRWPRLRILARSAGRLVLAGWLLVGGGWLAAPTAAGPSHPPLGALWLWGPLASGLPC